MRETGRILIEALLALWVIAAVLLPASALQVAQLRKIQLHATRAQLEGELEEVVQELRPHGEHLQLPHRAQPRECRRGEFVTWNDERQPPTVFVMRWIAGVECDLLRVSATRKGIRCVIERPLQLP